MQMRSPSAARSKLLRSTSKHSTKAQLSLSRKSSKSSDTSAASEEGDENNQPGLHQQQQQRDNNNNSTGDMKAASSPAAKAVKEDAKAVEVRMKKQLTKLRARVQAIVTDAQLETQCVHQNSVSWLFIRSVCSGLMNICFVSVPCASNRNLRSQLQSEKQIHERKEQQLRVETNAKMFALEVRLSCQGFDICF